MVTGSLGAGGAERQLTITARTIQAAGREGRRIGGFDVVGPVTVLCRSMRSRAAADFFLADLVGDGIVVREYRTFANYGGMAARSLISEWRNVLALLPPEMREGTSRMADYLRVSGPQVLHIWQDGSVLAAGLAAVIARVPKIILSARGLPPVDRPARNKSEYQILYRRLLALPGIRLTANSSFVASRYAEWLGVPERKINVIYNGVGQLPTAPQEDSEALLSRFDAQTGLDCYTVGSVMRLDENKRPSLWLEAAANVSSSNRRARFIIVGDGPLIWTARQMARSLGIANRVLFVGRRRDVGFWLSKMDSFMLLSRQEGLPNALIEAQLAGVPVVATPAGGSVEAIYPSGRDFVLSEAENPSAAEAATKLMMLTDRSTRQNLGGAAQKWAEKRFSVNEMVTSTVELYCA